MEHMKSHLDILMFAIENSKELIMCNKKGRKEIAATKNIIDIAATW